MKYLFPIRHAAVLVLLSACQPHTKPAAVGGAVPRVAASEKPGPGAATTLPTPPDSAEAATTAMPLTKLAPLVKDLTAFLAANNLAPLWQADFGQRESDSSRPTILDGFYGPEHRHIAFILDKVAPDSLEPNVFRVQGRTRYKKSITPFEGSITVQSIKPGRLFLDLDSAETAQARAYTATAQFVLREDSTTTGAGTYQGMALMDFYRLPSGRLNLVQVFPDKKIPTGGGGLLFRGQWKSLRTGQRKTVAFATYTDAVLPNTMADLYIGDRGENINPKYAGLDWNEAWDNDEWWAKSPQPKLTL